MTFIEYITLVPNSIVSKKDFVFLTAAENLVGFNASSVIFTKDFELLDLHLENCEELNTI